jgi:alpha-ketoglutarate-dependent taurine dioxygenase
VFIGAMIENQHLTDFTEQDIYDLKKILFYRKVVFFENQNLTRTQIKELGEKLKVDTETSVYVEDLDNSINHDYGSGWHSDKDYETKLPNYTIFQMEQLSSIPMSGDTEFLDMVNFYNYAHSDHIKQLLEQLTATHEHTRNENKFIDDLGQSMIQKFNYLAVHPVVLETSFEDKTVCSLFLNPTHVTKINELKKIESDAILDAIFKKMAMSSELQYRHRWKKGSLVIWNNRLCLHRALKDFYEGDIRRAIRAVVY